MAPKSMNIYNGEKISCVFMPINQGLPTFKQRDPETGEFEHRRYKVQGDLALSAILDYLYNDLNVKESFLDAKRD